MNDTGITFEEMQGLLKGVYEIYGKGRSSDFTGEGFMVNGESVRLWHWVLGVFPYDIVFRVFAEHIRDQGGFPIPCDIYRACSRRLAEELERAEIESSGKENG